MKKDSVDFFDLMIHSKTRMLEEFSALINNIESIRNELYKKYPEDDLLYQLLLKTKEATDLSINLICRQQGLV